MAITVIRQARALLLLSLCCMAWGTLDLPKVTRVHAGQKTHILCTHTCQFGDDCAVQMDWKDRPPEFRGFKRCYNGSHHSLRMTVEAGSQETVTHRYFTCVAKIPDEWGEIPVEEESTRLEICPTETLRCRLKMELHATNIVSYVSVCEYRSECGTELRCQSNTDGLPSHYLAYKYSGSWNVEECRIIGLMPGDNVTCRLHSPLIEEHLQTSFELRLPEESSPKLTSQVPNTQATMQAPDTETKTYPPTKESLPTSAPNQCPVYSCDCVPVLLWVLFTLISIALQVVCVRIVYNKNYKNKNK